MSSTANRVVKNTGFLYAQMGITMFISLYTTRVILNALGAIDFGIFNIIGGAISMLGFLNVAMASATQRFMSYSEGSGDTKIKKKIFNTSLILHLIIATIASVLLIIGGYFFFNGILNIPTDRISAAQVVYGSLIASTFFTIITVPYDAVINAHENMKYYAIISIIGSLLKLLIAIIIIYTLQDKLIVYALLTTGVSVFMLIIMQTYCHHKYTECAFTPRKYFSPSLMKSMTAFAGWNLIGVTSSMISQYGLGIVLNNFWGALLNTAQGIANQISGQLMVFSNTMLKALNPVIAKSEGSGNRALMLKASMTGSKFAYIILAVFAIPFIIETPYILKIWLKSTPEWTIVFCRLQLLRSLIEQLTITLGSSIAAQGEIKGYSLVRSILGLLPIILSALLFHFHYPPYYMYVAWILCNGIIGGLFSIYFFHKKCNVNYATYTREVLLPCLLFTVIIVGSGILPSYFLTEGIVRLGITLTTTILFSLVTLWCLVLNNEEKKTTQELISIIKNRITHNN